MLSSTNKEKTTCANNVEIKVITAERMFLYGIILVFISWFNYGKNSPSPINPAARTLSEWGQYGDGFGALNCLFTGLAFVGVFAAFWHERRESLTREKLHAVQMNEFRADAERRNVEQLDVLRRMETQTIATIQTARVNAVIARLTRLQKDDDFHSATKPPEHEPRKSLIEQMEPLQRILDEFIARTPPEAQAQ